MAGKRYSAGAIFLQVVPVFANVQRAIEDEVKDIDRALGDKMEKAGEKAGERAGKAASKKLSEELAKGSGQFERDFHKNIDGINRALGGIDVKKLGNGLRREITEVKKELAGLKDVDITGEADFRRVFADIAVLEGRVRGLRDNVKIVFRSDVDDALKGFGKVAAAKEAISDPVEIEVSADFKVAERQMGSFEKSIKRTMEKAARHMDGSMNKSVRNLRNELDHLSKLRVGIDIGSNQLRREVAVITSQLERLSQEEVEIDAKFEASRAWAELAAFDDAVERLDGKNIDIKADVDTSRARTGLFGIARSGNDAANSFRSFNIILLATASLGPALIPMLAAVAGGMLALGPAAAVAGAGLGSVLVGFSGLGDALTALQSQQDQMAMTTQAAAKTEVNGARAVADARRSAARAVESALDQQKDAQERYRDSINDVREAELALKEAREAAKGTGDDISDRIKDNQLAQDQGLLDVFNATVTYNSTMADGSATNAEKEQARIDLERARRALEEFREEAKELAKEKRKWDKEGVNGTDEVKDAQERLNDAIDAQKDAYEGLRDAAENVDRARADGARMVADAIRSQGEALDQVNAQQNAVNVAFGKLGKEGQAFALFLHGLRGEFRDFRDDIQAVLLPAVQEAMIGFFDSKNAEIARGALIGLAEGFGKFAKALSVSFQGPAWAGFFQMLADLGPDIQAAYGGAFIAFMEAMASMLTTLAPFALLFAEGLEKMMLAFADWTASKAGQDALIGFMEYAQRIGPPVLEFLEAFIGAALNLAIALAPWGEMVFSALTMFLDFIAAMDPKILGAIANAFVVLIIASQVAYAFMNLLMAGAALLTSAIGLWVFAIVGIGLALAYLYTRNEEFRDFIDEAWSVIREVIKESWEEYIKPALIEFGDALMVLWQEVLAPFLRWLAPILLWVAENVLPLLFRYWAMTIRTIAWLIKNVAVPGLKLWGEYTRFMWREFIKPTIDNIREAWGHLMDAMVWTWKNVLKPAWDYITDTALPALESAFQATVDAIGDIWGGLQALFATPIDFLLDGVINNGFIDGYNTVARWVHADELDHITVPKYIQKHSAFATGGILPGYTPGRDVHDFVSPTAGRLSLSGGEAIMRPEWTAAMGSDYVNQMNALARKGGVNAIRNAFNQPGYWMGGVLPLPGGSVSSHGGMYGHPAFDLNYPGYADFGAAVKAFKDGIVAQMNYIGDQSYGRWAVLNHAGGQATLYAHLSNFADIAVGKAVRAGQTIGYVGDIGNTGTPPTSHLHFEIMGGAVDYADNIAKAGKPRRSIPGWLMDVVKDPLGSVKGWITKPFGDLPGTVANSPLLGMMKNVPLLLAEKATDKVWDIIPGWVKTAAGWAGDAAGWVVGGVKNAAGAAGDVLGDIGGGIKDAGGATADFLGLKDGGILPYNGTMMYDAGGYLPPGLTSVVNLTGKPEPVFTNDQWADMERGGGDGTIHYEPHFEGSDLTAEDVAGDMNFTFRRLRRGGKYAGVGEQ